MDDIRRVVRVASWRLTVIEFLRTLAVTLTAGTVGLLVARVVEKVLGYQKEIEPQWPRMFLWTCVGVVVAAAVWAAARRRKVLSVARELDERAGLKESLSTALCIENSPDPWAAAVIETAKRQAKSVNVGDAIPIEWPRLWPAPIAAAVVLFLTWITLHDVDLTGRFKKQVAAEETKRQVVQVKEAIASDRKKLDEMLAKAKVDLKDEKADDKGDQAGKEERELDPSANERAAVKQLTDVTEKLGALKESEKGAQVDAMKEAMRQLKQPNDGPLNDFSKALARGDFNKAEQAMSEMSKQIAEGTMTPEQSKAAKDQLENLAKQLEKISENKDAVQKQLEKAGLDAKKAAEVAKAAMKDPEAIKKAMEEMKNLTPEQQQAMMKMAQAASEACKNAAEMSSSMSQMAQGMTQSGLQQEGQQGMESLEQQLSQAENMQNDMQNLDAALQEAKSQLEALGKSMCKNGGKPGEGEGEEGMGDPSEAGQWRQGASDKYGQGSGGPGKGNGGARPEEEADFAFEKKKANSQTTQGQIIGNRLVYGQQVKGESVAEFSNAVEAAAKAASEAIDSQTVAREYHEPMKRYFSTLQSKVKADRPTLAPATSPTPTPTPAPTSTPTPAPSPK